MKPIRTNIPIMLWVLLFINTGLYGQNSKTVYGNFVYQNEVYQYQCEKNSSGIYRFSISTLEPANVWSGFKVADVDSALSFIKRQSPEIIAGSDSLVAVLGSIRSLMIQQATWTAHAGVVDSLVKQVKGGQLDSNHVLPLLSAYKEFLNTNKTQNHSKVRTTAGLQIESFRTNFFNALTEVSVSEKKTTNSKEVNDIANQVFYSILARIEFMDDEPVTAYVKLKKKYVDVAFTVPVDTNKPVLEKRVQTQYDNDDERYDSLVSVIVRCEIARVSLEFDERTLKNVLIDVIPSVKEYNDQFQNTFLRFRNNMPISVSTKFDPDAFNRHRIFISNSRELQQNLLQLARIQHPDLNFIENEVKNHKDDTAKIILSEVLDLWIELENDKEDFSPANCVVELTPAIPVIELKKERRSKILTVVGFTDFVGLNNTNPNGLVQFEAYKRINIYTRNFQGRNRYVYFGFFQYTRPRFSWNKIEENNKYLYFNSSQIDSASALKSKQLSYTYNTLKVFQYRIFGFQIDLNLVTMNLPNKKLGFGINTLFNYGNTLVADSLSYENGAFSKLGTRNTRNMGTGMFGFDVYCDIKPDSRYGLSAGWNPGYLNVWEANFLPDPNYKRLIQRYYVNAFIRTNDNSKLFFRFSVQHTHKNYRNHYYQAQLGYIIDLFSSSAGNGNQVTAPPRP